MKDKKLAFFFLSEEERKDFAKRNFNPLAFAIKIKKAFRSFFYFYLRENENRRLDNKIDPEGLILF